MCVNVCVYVHTSARTDGHRETLLKRIWILYVTLPSTTVQYSRLSSENNYK